MNQLIYHCQETIEKDRLVQDGQFSAMILESLYVKVNTLYLIRHGLGRPVNQYSVIFSDRPITIPYCPRDPVTGLQTNDNERIALVFSDANVTVRMRFA